MTVTYEMSHLDKLESEAVFIFREVAAAIERPALLFSGGKDSVVMLHLAVKAFWPAPVPFPVMHIDTGENFDEVLDFRDRTVQKYGLRLIVASVQDDIDAGRSVEDTGPRATRNRLQTVSLLRGINENQFGYIGEDGFLVLGPCGTIDYFRGLVHLYVRRDRQLTDEGPPKRREVSAQTVNDEVPTKAGR